MDRTTIPKMVRETIVPGMDNKRKSNALLALKRSGLLEFVNRGNQYKSPKDYFINYDLAKFPPSVKAQASQDARLRSFKLQQEFNSNKELRVRGKPRSVQKVQTESIQPVVAKETQFEPVKQTSQVEVPLKMEDLSKGGFSLTLNINFTINK